jgi:osmotically-inducible protein OsmY
MKIRKIIILLSFVLLSSCVGYSSTGVLGTGVSIALDPRSLGTQIDDSLMQQNLRAKLLSTDKSYIISVKTKILDGRIFLTGKVNSVEDKLKITKLAWEIKGARSVNNDLQIKEKFNFKRSAKDLLITSQLRAALIGSKNIKAVNYNIDTYKKKIYVYGIAQNKKERDEVIKEAKQILDVEDVVTSIFLVDDLRVVKK